MMKSISGSLLFFFPFPLFFCRASYARAGSMHVVACACVCYVCVFVCFCMCWYIVCLCVRLHVLIAFVCVDILCAYVCVCMCWYMCLRVLLYVLTCHACTNARSIQDPGGQAQRGERPGRWAHTQKKHKKNTGLHSEPQRICRVERGGTRDGPTFFTKRKSRIGRGETRDGRAWQTRCWEGSTNILQIVFYYWYFTICSISICSSLLVFYYLERDRPGAERRGAEGRGQLYRVRLPSLGRKVHLLHRQKRPVILTFHPSVANRTCIRAPRHHVELFITLPLY